MGKDKLRKFAENLTFPNMFQPSIEEAEQGFSLKGKWKQDFFKNDHSLTLELGCGKGEYSVGLAKKYTERNFIGVDIKGARMWRGCKTSNDDKMKNVAFLRTRIQLIIPFFDKGEVDEIWITFPDPQPKKENKRLTAPALLNIYKHFLKSDGIIHLKTDDRDLYEYTLEVIAKEGHTLLLKNEDLYNPANEHLEVMEIQTHYEGIWLKMGKKINYVRFQLKN